jgi:hypothetical protein
LKQENTDSGLKLPTQRDLPGAWLLNLLKAIEDRLGTMLPEGCEGDLVGVRTVGELVDRLVAVLAADASDSAAAP